MLKDFWSLAMKQLGQHVFSREHAILWNITPLSFMGANYFVPSADINSATRPVPLGNILLG
jgi:hypothetical protein